MVIDAHQHFWQYNPVSHAWINEQMAILKRNFLPPDLQQEYITNQVDGCVAVQADQSEKETHFLLDLAQQNDFIKGVVGWVDLRSEVIDERLVHFSQYAKLCGFRHIVQDEPDVNFMLRDDFQSGISLLAKYGFTYDILIFPTQMEAALKLVQNFPEQKFIIDHIAKPYIKDGKIDRWADYMHQIAAHSNTYCKVSGIVTEADWKDWSYEQIEPYLEVVYNTFGANRLCYGSDWPVCLLAASYQDVKSIPETFAQRLSATEKQKFMAQNAISFYGLAI